MSERMTLAEVIRQFCNACNATENADVTREAAPALAVTPITPVTPEKSNAERENESAPACTVAWLQAQGVEPLHRDLAFIASHLPADPGRRAELLRAYAKAWREAADAEPLPHKKENAGIKHANTLLREGKL